MNRTARAIQLGLKVIGDGELIRRIEALTKKERSATLEILLHLVELDRRRLHLEHGYASLFEYCVRRLRYSESGANRRIRAARCIRDFPEVYDLLARREVNLSAVSLISNVLNRQNKADVLPRVCHKSLREVEAIVSEYRPQMFVRDRVRPVSIVRPSQDPQGPTLHAAPTKRDVAAPTPESWPDPDRRSGGREFTTGEKPAPTETKQVGQLFRIEFAARPEFMAKLQQVRSLMSSKHPRGVPFEQLFEALMDEYIERNSPSRRAGRRRKQEKAKAPAKQKESPGSRSRQISQRARDKVYARDNGRCAFVGKGGRRCTSTWDLEIDHIIPYAKGGGNSASNLRLLCARHNRVEAERVYGKRFMKRFHRRD